MNPEEEKILRTYESLRSKLESEFQFHGHNAIELIRTDIIWHLRSKIGKVPEIKSSSLNNIATTFFQTIKDSTRRPASGNYDVLLFPYTLNQLKTLIPVINALDHKLVVCTEGIRRGNILKSSVQTELKKNNIPYALYEGYLPKKWRVEINAWEAEHNIDVPKELLGFDFERYVKLALKYVLTTEAIVAAHNPKLMIVANEMTTPGRVMVMVAKKLGKKTLHIQHGAVDSVPPYGPILSDKMAVTGKNSKEILVSCGAQEEKLVITGQPRYDEIVSTNYNSNELLNSLNLDDSKKIVLVATSDVGKTTNEKLLKPVFEASKNIEGIQVVVKVHPREDTSLHKSIAKKCGISVPILKDVSLYPILSAASVVVVTGSTVGLEALIFDKPVIDVNFSGQNFSQPYVGAGVALGVTSPDKLESAIFTLLNDSEKIKKLAQNRQEFLNSSIYKLDGKATERILGLIATMIGSDE